MMTAKQLDALKALWSSLGYVIDVFNEDDATAELPAAPVVEKKRGSTASTTSRSPAKESKPVKHAETSSEEGEVGVNGYTESQLEDMGYNGMKSLAKKLGLKAVGDRTALLDILMNQSPSNEDEDEDVPPAKSSKKSAPPEKEDEDEDEDADDIEEMVNAAVAKMSDEEIADYLADEGLPTKGKRQALIATMVKGVRSGKIELDYEDEVSDSMKNEEEEYGINDLTNPEMTEERRAGIAALASDIRGQFATNELTRKDMVSFIKEYKGSSEGLKELSEKELLARYIDAACLFVSDEGEMPDEDEPSVYTVNGEAYCCGHSCAYDEDAGYICEACGNEYAVDDEDE